MKQAALLITLLSSLLGFSLAHAQEAVKNGDIEKGEIYIPWTWDDIED